MPDWNIGQPHYIDSDDCMGRPEKCWCVLGDYNGESFCGTGRTAEIARGALVAQLEAARTAEAAKAAGAPPRGEVR